MKDDQEAFLTYMKTKNQPISLNQVHGTTCEQRYFIENIIVDYLINIINNGMKENVLYGHFNYNFDIPTFIFGYPMFDSKKVAKKIEKMFIQEGYTVNRNDLNINISWKQQFFARINEKEKNVK